MGVSFIDRYPYGKAPFALLVIAIVSVGLRVATARRHDERPDLVIVTHTDAHYDRVPQARSRASNASTASRCSCSRCNWASLQSRLQNAMLAGHRGARPRGAVRRFDGLLHARPRRGLRRHGPHRSAAAPTASPIGWSQSRFSLWSARGRIYALPHDVHPVMLAYRTRPGREAGHRRVAARHLGQVRRGRPAASRATSTATA